AALPSYGFADVGGPADRGEDAERDAEELLHAPPARASTASRSSATRARSASSSDAVSGTAPAADRSPPDSRATQARAVTTSAVASATAARPASRCAEETSSGGTRVVRAVVDPSDRKSTRLNSSHVKISYAVFCLKKK